MAGSFNMAFEHTINSSQSIQFAANYWYRIFGFDVRGYGASIHYRFFVTSTKKTIPQGLFIGPKVAINGFKNLESAEQNKVLAVGVGPVLGYQWIFNSDVSLELAGGTQYYFAEKIDVEESFDGFLPHVVFAIGYNF